MCGFTIRDEGSRGLEDVRTLALGKDGLASNW